MISKSRILISTVWVVFAGVLYSQQKYSDFPVSRGPYFSQELPGGKAELFAPDIITYEVHASPSISPDGREMIIDSMEEGFKYYRLMDNAWTLQPELPFTLPGVCNGALLSPSGNSAYLLIGSDFYMSKKHGEKWGELQSLGAEVNAFKPTWQYSAAENENVYFACGYPQANVMVSV